MNLFLTADGRTLKLGLAPYFMGAKGVDGEFSALAAVEQSFTSLAVWTVTHSLAANPPHVAIVDAAGRAIIASVEHVSTTQVNITHNSPQTGKVRLS